MADDDKIKTKTHSTNQEGQANELGFFDRHELIANGLSTAAGVATGALFVTGAKAVVDKLSSKKKETARAALFGGGDGISSLFK